MKKILVLILASFSLATIAQEKLTEGILIGKQSMSSDNEEMNSQLKLMGDSPSTIYFKGNKSRSETSSPMTGEITIIMDNGKKELLMLMSSPMQGKKYASQAIETKPEDLENITIIKGEETKTILGYECQQYIIKLNEQGQEMEMQMFTTDKISAPTQSTTNFAGKIDGFPLYFVIKMSQMGSSIEVVSEVTEIKKEKVSDDKFSLTPPEGYEKMEGM